MRLADVEMRMSCRVSWGQRTQGLTDTTLLNAELRRRLPVHLLQHAPERGEEGADRARERAGASACMRQERSRAHRADEAWRAQVRDLYGPLLACVTATKSAFDAMVRQHSASADGSPADFIAAARENPEGPEGLSYRRAPWCSTQVLKAAAEPRPSNVGSGCGPSCSLSTRRRRTSS